MRTKRLMAAAVIGAVVAVIATAAPTQQARLTPPASFGGNSDYGHGVGIDGDTAVVGAWLADVGANFQQGSACVYTRTGTTWTQQAVLTAPDGHASAHFGLSCDVSGDTLIVGAHDTTPAGGQESEGAAYVFTRSGAVWTLQQRLSPPSPAFRGRFGFGVALEGDTAVVGGNLGPACVYVRSAGVWTLQAQLLGNDTAVGHSFGNWLSISGDTVVAGAPGVDTAAGAAYVFKRTGTSWAQQAKLVAPDRANADLLGWSVSISGDTVIAGGRFDDVGANADQGSACVFVRSGTTWTFQQKLVGSDSAANSNFSYSVAVEGDTAIAGEEGWFAGGAQVGTVRLFTRSGGVWTEQPKLLATAPQGFELLGSSVALSQGSAIGGARNIRAAYVFAGLPVFSPDSDRDGASDAQEALSGTDANDRDSDDDGVEDGVEIRFGSNPLSAASPASRTDADADGVPNAMEASLGMIVGNADQDADGFRDGYEYARNGNLGGAVAFGDANLSGGRPNLADAQLLTKITLGTASQGTALNQDLDIDRSMGAPARADATLLTYFAQGRIPMLPYP